MARLKLRNGFKVQVFKLVIIIILIIISFVLTFKFLYDKIDIEVDNNTYLDLLVKDSFTNYNLSDIKSYLQQNFY